MMKDLLINRDIAEHQGLIFAGDYEVVGPDPSLGQQEVAELGVSMIFIHYHHRHEFQDGANKGLWGSICRGADSPLMWEEIERTVDSAKARFPLVAMYPIGWAHMVPQHLGETVLDIDVETLSDWVSTVVGRFHDRISLFPIFYELNVFELFYRTTHGFEYSFELKAHIVKTLVRSYEKVLAMHGEVAASKLTAATFVELTQSSFYWMSEGSLLELPRGSSMLDAPLSPPDLLAVAKQLDTEQNSDRHVQAIRQLLHQIVFWNADDSGANDTVADDIKRLEKAGFFYDAQENPQGFVHLMIAGWDGQPQNTYEYLMHTMLPQLEVPDCAQCLATNYAAFEDLRMGSATPAHVKNAIYGFVLDDVFKCTKQSGITSAVYPTEEKISKHLRVAGAPINISEIGKIYKNIIHGAESQKIKLRA